jgi:tetratricopeptide (TPR) repeat protein
MAQTAYRFYRLSMSLARKLRLDPIPFPVRARHVKSIFQSKTDSVPVDRLLEEMDQFLHDHPNLANGYASNAARLAMICATRHVSDGNFPAALDALNAGLRADPQDQGLKAHQALALQALGHHAAAAMIYEQLLWEAPRGFDPLLRALAAKAFAASGDRDKARELLEFLPEQAVRDASLAKLRAAL